MEPPKPPPLRRAPRWPVDFFEVSQSLSKAGIEFSIWYGDFPGTLPTANRVRAGRFSSGKQPLVPPGRSR